MKNPRIPTIAAALALIAVVALSATAGAQRTQVDNNPGKQLGVIGHRKASPFAIRQ